MSPLQVCQMNRFPSYILTGSILDSTILYSPAVAVLRYLYPGMLMQPSGKEQRCEMSPVTFRGLCLFFHCRSGGRLSGTAGTICTSGEESSVEWSSAQLDTDEQPSSDEWLVGSKATQLNSYAPPNKLQILEYGDQGAIEGNYFHWSSYECFSSVSNAVATCDRVRLCQMQQIITPSCLK